MALKPEDEKLFWTLANDPASRKEMLEKAEKLGLKEHPAIQDNRHFQDRLDAELKPLREQLSEALKKLDEKEKTDFHAQSLAEIRRPPFNFNDEKLAKLREYMQEPGQPSFQSYAQAANYYREKFNPAQTSSSPLFALSPLRDGQEESDWRQRMQSDDKAVNPAMMSKRQRHNYASAEWKKASEELAREIAGSSRY